VAAGSKIRRRPAAAILDLLVPATASDTDARQKTAIESRFGELTQTLYDQAIARGTCAKMFALRKPGPVWYERLSGLGGTGIGISDSATKTIPGKSFSEPTR
jgi:hypothetical protein